LDADTEIRLDNFLENVAASDGTINLTQVRPDDTGYDSSNPSYYRGAKDTLSVRIADDMTVDYGITADDPAFEKLIRALYTVKNANVTPGNIDSATLETALGLAVESIVELPVIVSEVGASRLTFQNFKNRHEDFLVFTQETVSQIENVDIAEAVARLSSEQLLLEASYTLIAQLRQLSLANFL
jgi:flagellar hook-associated protein 3 FlgL